MKSRKNKIALATLFTLALTLIIPTALSAENSYTPITTCQELQNIHNDLDGNYYLTNNIDCSITEQWNGGKGFKPIGNLSEEDRFKGSFDGQGYVISDLYIDRESTKRIGLFGYTGSDANITDIGLKDVNITGYYGVGGLIGVNFGSVSDSYATGSVTGSSYVGGLVGLNFEGSISSSYSTGSVNGGNHTGGLTGYNYNRVSNSYSTSSVAGENNVGGLIGINGEGSVSNSYTTGSVTGSGEKIGGLIGWDEDSVYNSYWNYETTNQDSGIGKGTSTGVIGRNTSEMTWEYSNDTYQGWNFVETWLEGDHATVKDHEGNIGYPALSWQEWKEPPKENYTLTVNTDGQGTVDVNPDQYEYEEGTEVTITANADQGWIFQEWTGDHSGIDDQITVTMDEDKEVTAHFKEDTDHEINTCQELQNIQNDLDENYYLASNIDCSITEQWNGRKGFKPIGDANNQFTGTLNGGTYKITDLYIDRPESNNIGLFSALGEEATVKNTRLRYTDITGDQVVGTIAGVNKGKIEKSNTEGQVKGNYYTGGLTGRNKGTIQESHVKINVEGEKLATGGITGVNKGEGTIKQTYAKGIVNGEEAVGGITGYNQVEKYTDEKAKIKNTYSTTSVKGEISVGGITGQNTGTIEKTYAKGTITGTEKTGGLIGKNKDDYDYQGSCSASFWDREKTNQDTDACYQHSTGHTTSEMKEKTTYTDAGWNFQDTWNIITDFTYPSLTYQNKKIAFKLKNPDNNEINTPTNPKLKVKVGHADQEELDVSFYNARTNRYLGKDHSVESGTTATLRWENLEPEKTYKWRVEATDGTNTAESKTWKFRTGEEKTPTPGEIKIKLINPDNGETEVSTDPELKVHVEDKKENRNMSVVFYNQENDQMIGYRAVKDGEGTASTTWENLKQDKTYRWYIQVHTQENTTQSNTWRFTTTKSKEGFIQADAGKDQETQVNQETQFNGQAHTLNTEVTKYKWDFNGNGEWNYESNETGQTTHTYTETGVYTAKLQVQDNKGNIDYDTKKITVTREEEQPPEQDIASSINLGRKEHTAVTGLYQYNHQENTTQLKLNFENRLDNSTHFKIIIQTPKKVAENIEQIDYDPEPDEIILKDPTVAWNTSLAPMETFQVTMKTQGYIPLEHYKDTKTKTRKIETEQETEEETETTAATGLAIGTLANPSAIITTLITLLILALAITRREEIKERLRKNLK